MQVGQGVPEGVPDTTGLPGGLQKAGGIWGGPEVWGCGVTPGEVAAPPQIQLPTRPGAGCSGCADLVRWHVLEMMYS